MMKTVEQIMQDVGVGKLLKHMGKKVFIIEDNSVEKYEAFAKSYLSEWLKEQVVVELSDYPTREAVKKIHSCSA